ncbi:MAG: stage sporulation protein [Acidimicrobiia bacterium]|nr:stage sporulation protein [Acidimicrobiia bacterium]
MRRTRRILAALIAALMLLVALPDLTMAQALAPVATADTAAGPPSFHFEGGGWGHGVGMSQYGAYNRAQRGQTAEQILSFYYQGSIVQPVAQPSSVRIWMAETPGASGVVLTAGSQPINIWAANSGQPVGWAAAGASPRITVANGAIKIADDVIAGADRVWVDLDPASPVTVNPPAYRFNRGRAEIIMLPGGVLRVIISNLGMQEYMYGISEVPSSWPMEVLRAQAIAARSYAAEKIGRAGLDQAYCDCSLVGDQGDQVYVGYEKEAGAGGANWVAAVNATDSLLATYNGAPVQAFYSSSNGGYTEASEDAFVAALPYLRAVPDPDDVASPDHRWTRDYSQSELTRWLSAASDTNVGVVQSVDVVPPLTTSGRVGRVQSATQGGVRISGTAGVKRVSGGRFQSVVNSGVFADGFGYNRTLKSTLFWVGSTPHYQYMANAKLAGVPIGCADVAWAATQRLIRPIEVRFLADIGVSCPDAAVSREAAPSTQYVVMLALAANGGLTCADLEWSSSYGYLTWTAAVNLRSMIPGCLISTYAYMVVLQVSGRLTCDDIAWNRDNGFITPLQASWLAGAGAC